jgi:thermostable 8-oxoguanine DNA glycosylase
MATRKPKPIISGPYSFKVDATQNVVMLLDKVDVTYVNESKNAFARYTSDNYRAANITVSKEVLDKDLSLVVFTSFTNAEEALAFLKKVKKAAPDEVSWLPANKYSFILIDDDNLERLRNTKDVTGYKNLLKKLYPDQF